MKYSGPVRDRLLAVSRELFTRRGYEGTSVREITSRARANLGAVTYHFGSKESLYHATLATIAEPLAERIARESQTTGSPLDRVEAMMRGFLEHVTENPEAPPALLRELSSDRAIAPPIASGMRRNLTALSQAIVAGQQDGTIRPGDPRLLALSVVAQPFYITVAGRMMKEAMGVDPKDPATRSRIIDHIIETVRRSLVSDTKASP